MKIPLQRLDKKIFSVIRMVGRLADKKSVPAYVVGGVVRDLILRKRNYDLDIVLEKDAILFAKHFIKEFSATAVFYPRFGTATITLKNGFQFDLATARKEVYATSGALPEVKGGSLRDDILRRDFTINVLACSINVKTFGELIDYSSGLADIKAKKIRVLHRKSFLDDPTRILRAVRFEKRFNFTIEPATLALLKEALANHADSYVKPQRYFEEFKKVLIEKNPQEAIERLAAFNGLDFLGCGYMHSKAMKQMFAAIGKNVVWFKEKFPHRKNLKEWLIYFMAMLHLASFAVTKEIVEKFNLRKEDRESILLAKTVDKIIERISNRLAQPYDIYKTLKPLSNEAILFCLSEKADPFIRKHVQDFFEKYESIRLSINGDDLKRMGVASGSRMGYILEAVLHQKINGNIHSRRQELRLAEGLK